MMKKWKNVLEKITHLLRFSSPNISSIERLEKRYPIKNLFYGLFKQILCLYQGVQKGKLTVLVFGIQFFLNPFFHKNDKYVNVSQECKVMPRKYSRMNN